MDPLVELVNRGFSGIVLKFKDSYESQSGMQPEVDTWEVWARDRKGQKVHFDLNIVSDAMRSPRAHEGMQRVIEDSEYQTAIKEHGMRDTPLWHKEQALKKARLEQITVQISQLTPRCPDGHQMLQRTRKSDGRAFYGCSKYPLCKATRTLDPRRERLLETLYAECNRLR